MKRIKFKSFYMKLIAVFLGIGLIPLILMGLLIYNTYSATFSSNVLSNYQQMTGLLAENLSGFMKEISDSTEKIYRLDITDYDYFYELFEDEELSETGKSAVITKVLQTILYMNDHIEHVLFIGADGSQFFSMRPPELLMDSEYMTTWYQAHYLSDDRRVEWIPTHNTSYFVNSDSKSFSVYRNIMNTSTIQKASTEVLGTLFISVQASYVEKLIAQTGYGAGHEVYLVDLASGEYVYHPKGIYEEANAWTDQVLQETMKEAPSGQLLSGNQYYVYNYVGETGWAIVDRFDADIIDGSYRRIRNNTFLMIAAAGTLLMVLCSITSRKLGKPVKELKDAMGCIEKGNLDVRVDIHSRDEMEDIGKGLNQMVENLKAYIQKAYVAEIRQRDAELEALTTQIQPHYLYNTLDVIRMSAITNDDMVVADMINSLSAQLKYLIGARGKMVLLRDEIACIRNYFRLLEIRYDYLYSLRIDVEEELLSCKVPHLIIQPVVENAVKHGLRPKKGTGEVVVSARKKEHCLELSVMDNGVGMKESRLQEIQQMLKSSDRSHWEDVAGMSIGIKNVSERIHHLYGEKYGMEIEAYEGIGTIVKYWLPLMWREEEPIQQEEE